MEKLKNMNEIELLEAIQTANDNIGLYMNCGQIKTANERSNDIGEMVAELMSRPIFNSKPTKEETRT